jgi:hypothetical protein
MKSEIAFETYQRYPFGGVVFHSFLPPPLTEHEKSASVSALLSLRKFWSYSWPEGGANVGGAGLCNGEPGLYDAVARESVSVTLGQWSWGTESQTFGCLGSKWQSWLIE